MTQRSYHRQSTLRRGGILGAVLALLAAASVTTGCRESGPRAAASGSAVAAGVPLATFWPDSL